MPDPAPPLNYQTPQATPPSGKNKWWMVTLRILAGITAGVASGALGSLLATLTHIGGLFLLPPTLMFGVLLFVCIKYRRFGYVTGFIIAPFLVVVAVIIFLAIYCGLMITHP